MKQTVLFFFILLCYLPLQAQTVTGSFDFDGIERDYRLYIPEGYDGTTEMPLVFNLHGYTSFASQQELYSQMGPVADDGYFLVCYPNGVDFQWNTGFGSDVDDVGFINALIDTLIANYPVNEKRIYSTGMSNGGYMSYKLACELNDRIAAVASVTGSMTPEEAMACEPGRPVPVLQIHGTLDAVVPYDGSNFSISMDELIDFWLANNGCTNNAEVFEVPDINVVDGCTATRYTYSECEPFSEVVFYQIINGAHTWPGGAIPIPGTNYDFNASEVIWEFFNKYELEGIVSNTTNREVTAPAIQAYPNPITNEICFSELNDAASLALYDTFGRLIASRAHDLSNCWDISNLELLSGMYFLTLQTDQWTKTIPLTK